MDARDKNVSQKSFEANKLSQSNSSLRQEKKNLIQTNSKLSAEAAKLTKINEIAFSDIKKLTMECKELKVKQADLTKDWQDKSERLTYD